MDFQHAGQAHELLARAVKNNRLAPPRLVVRAPVVAPSPATTARTVLFRAALAVIALLLIQVISSGLAPLLNVGCLSPTCSSLRTSVAYDALLRPPDDPSDASIDNAPRKHIRRAPDYAAMLSGATQPRAVTARLTRPRRNRGAAHAPDTAPHVMPHIPASLSVAPASPSSSAAPSTSPSQSCTISAELPSASPRASTPASLSAVPDAPLVSRTNPTLPGARELKWGDTLALPEMLSAVRHQQNILAPSREMWRAAVDVPVFQRDRDGLDAFDRTARFFACRTKGVPPTPYYTFETGVHPMRTNLDRTTLRHHAYQVFGATEEFRSGPYVRWASMDGPWMENYFVESFARPVLRVTAGPVANVSAIPRAYATVPQLNEPTPTTVEDLLPKAWKAVLQGSVQDYKVTVDPYDFDAFYPLVPIFIRWTDLQISNDFSPSVAAAMARKLQWILRRDVTYLVVIQYADGVYLKRQYSLKAFVANMLVISAGGSGNVPIPLLSTPRGFMDTPPHGQHQWDISFIGSQREGARKKAVGALKTVAELQPSLRVRIEEALIDDAQWLEAMRTSMLQFTPRGTGRTSFRLYEALALGLIPVYAYDQMWLPYVEYTPDGDPAASSIWDEIAHLVHVDSVSQWATESLPVIKADATRYNAMRARIREVYARYFTYEAVMKHIYEFVADPQQSELRCAKRTV